MTLTIRAELEPLPSRMKDLAIDERGYVVPWFVDYVDGKPEFRAMNPKKWIHAVRFKVCWVCGEKLGRYLTFVAGPMCGINRTSSEPPSHLECARWSARNCPFLNNPDAIRRVDDKVPLPTPGSCPGFPITRNPGVTMLWTTKDSSVFEDGKGMPLIYMGDAESVEWYACRRAATRAEVDASIDSGFPALVAGASTEPGGLAALNESRERFRKYLPAE